MRLRGDWMSRSDDSILEYALENVAVTSRRMADDPRFRVSQAYLSRRLKVLEEHGLLAGDTGGLYVLTDLGLFYLAGAYDAEKEEFVGDSRPSDHDGVDFETLQKIERELHNKDDSTGSE